MLPSKEQDGTAGGKHIRHVHVCPGVYGVFPLISQQGPLLRGRTNGSLLISQSWTGFPAVSLPLPPFPCGTASPCYWFNLATYTSSLLPLLLFFLLSGTFFLSFHLRISDLPKPSSDGPSSLKSPRVSSCGFFPVKHPRNALHKKVTFIKLRGTFL